MNEEIREALKEIAKTLHDVARMIESPKIDLDRTISAMRSLHDLEHALGIYTQMLVLDLIE